MERRSFLKTAGAGLAAATLGAPAIVRAEPQVKWRLASSFPKSLDTIYGAAEVLADRVRAITEGKFDIRVFAAGEIVPAFQVLDACQQGTVECGHATLYYFIGKNKAFAFDTALPFGLTCRQQNAWLYAGGGMELIRDFLRDYNVLNFPGGNTGTQMGGWFRKEIKSLSDVQGLKMRIAGLGGEILARLGAVPQQIPGGDIYPALEKGTIDAAEFVGPYDDEKLGFYKVAPHYYFPGFWEGGPNVSFLVNISEWEKLPKAYQEAFTAASYEANIAMIVRYDTQNPAALSRLVQNGTKLHAFPKDMMDAAFKAAHELYEEEAAKNPQFKTIYEPWKKFRSEEFQWFRVAEGTYQNYVYSQRY